MLPTQAPAPTPEQAGGRPDARSMLIDILTKAKNMAEQNGIDFEEVVQEVLQGGKSSPMPPAPPMPPMG